MYGLGLLGLMIWAGTAGWLLARWMAGFFCLLAICACVCGGGAGRSKASKKEREGKQ